MKSRTATYYVKATPCPEWATPSIHVQVASTWKVSNGLEVSNSKAIDGHQGDVFEYILRVFEHVRAREPGACFTWGESLCYKPGYSRLVLN